MKILPKHYTAIIYLYRKHKNGKYRLCGATTADGVGLSIESFTKQLNNAIKDEPKIGKRKHSIMALESSWLQHFLVLVWPWYFPRYKGKWTQIK